MVQRENERLAPYTTFGVGGPARVFLEAATEDDVARGVTLAAERGLPLFILGGGSNLLVSDAGFPGVVLRVMLPGITRRKYEPIVSAGAGVPWDDFVAWCVNQDLAGVECLSGIPGFAGGTPIQNVGAYNQEVAETIRAVRVYDRETLRFEDLGAEACGFTYRASAFNTTMRNRYIVVRVDYELVPGGAPNLRYPDVTEAFAGRTGAPSLLETREAVLAIRRRKAMVIEPGNPDTRSAGSFFKNPIVDEATFARITGLAGGDVPRFPAAGGLVKFPAARLIEAAGFQRGYRRGGAGISSRHTLALTNQDRATAREIFDLAREIRDGVRAKFGVELQPEPVFVGFEVEF